MLNEVGTEGGDIRLEFMHAVSACNEAILTGIRKEYDVYMAFL